MEDLTEAREATIFNDCSTRAAGPTDCAREMKLVTPEGVKR
jgi:hypothetical protein